MGIFVRFVILALRALLSAELASIIVEATESHEQAGFYLRKMVVRFDRKSSTTLDDDVAQFDLHWVNITAGEVDDSWDTTDFTTIEDSVTAAWANLKGQYPPQTVLKEIRWYRRQVGSNLTGPPVRVLSINSPGTGSVASQLPPQVAMSFTLKTVFARHWGRVYLPPPNSSSSTVTGQGRIPTAWVDTVSAQLRSILVSGTARGLYPVVYSPRLQAALAITATQMDDVYDVIRSRRWRATTYRKIYTS